MVLAILCCCCTHEYYIILECLRLIEDLRLNLEYMTTRFRWPWIGWTTCGLQLWSVLTFTPSVSCQSNSWWVAHYCAIAIFGLLAFSEIEVFFANVNSCRSMKSIAFHNFLLWKVLDELTFLVRFQFNDPR